MSRFIAPLKEDWDSDWAPVRNTILTLVGVIGYSVPGVLVMRRAFDTPPTRMFDLPILMLGIFLVMISVALFFPLLKEDVFGN